MSSPSLSPSAPSTLSFPSPSFSPSPAQPSTTTTSTTTTTTTSPSSASTTTASSSQVAVNLVSSTSSLPDAQPTTTTTATSTTTTSTSTSTSSASSTPAPDPAAGIATAVSLSSASSTSATFAPSATATPSPSGFFSDTGAVAGTFTVVGLVALAAVIALIMFFAKRRHSRSYDDDTEFLDKTPDLSLDPPVTQVSSPDDNSASDHAHYGPPMPAAPPPVAYYPDHAYALRPQAFAAQGNLPASHGYPGGYYPAQRFAPEDYNVSYPAVGVNMPHHGSADLELDSTSVPTRQAPLPDALRPSVHPTLSVPKRQSDRYSVDSFYAGIATDAPPSPGQAI